MLHLYHQDDKKENVVIFEKQINFGKEEFHIMGSKIMNLNY